MSSWFGCYRLSTHSRKSRGRYRCLGRVTGDWSSSLLGGFTRTSTGESWASLAHALHIMTTILKDLQGCVYFVILNSSLPLSLALSNDPCSKPHGLESDLAESKLLLFPGGKNI